MSSSTKQCIREILDVIQCTFAEHNAAEAARCTKAIGHLVAKLQRLEIRIHHLELRASIEKEIFREAMYSELLDRDANASIYFDRMLLMSEKRVGAAATSDARNAAIYLSSARQARAGNHPRGNVSVGGGTSALAKERAASLCT